MMPAVGPVTSKSGESGARRPLTIVLGAGAVLVYYLALALTRRIDADEGYYLYAARLVLEGRLPYRDFFYPQMPLLPYFWAVAGIAPGGVGWLGGRVLAAGVAWACALLFGALLARRVRARGAFLAVGAVYLVSDFGLEWAMTAKTYGPATALLLGAWLALGRAPSESGRFDRRAALAGFLVSLAVLARLTVAPAALVLPIVYLGLDWPKAASRKRWLIGYLNGLLPAAIVVGVFRALAPEAFVFDNWTYHRLGGPPAAERLRANLTVLLQMLISPLWLLAWAPAIAWIAASRRRPDRNTSCYAALAGVFIIVSTIPIRAFHQYYAMATPWLLLLAAPALEWAWGGVARRIGRARAAAAAVAMVMGLSLFQAQTVFARRWPTWAWRPETPEAAAEHDHRLGVARAVARELNARARPDDRLLTWWPGYGLEAAPPMVEGMENHFAVRVAKYVEAERARRLGALPAEEIERMITGRRVALVVVGLWTGAESWLGREHYTEMLDRAGYRKVWESGSAAIYEVPR